MAAHQRHGEARPNDEHRRQRRQHAHARGEGRDLSDSRKIILLQVVSFSRENMRSSNVFLCVCADKAAKKLDYSVPRVEFLELKAQCDPMARASTAIFVYKPFSA